MWLSLELLMENSLPRIVKQTNQNFCFGEVVKVSKIWLFIVLVLMPGSLLACYRGGGKKPSDNATTPAPLPTDYDTIYNQSRLLDDIVTVNLTGIRDPVERIVKTAWNGWEPSNETKQEWKDWYASWQEENEKNGEGRNRWKKTGTGEDGDGDGPGDVEPGEDRGPGSGWPQLPGWLDLGKGNPGVPIPPWAYVPKNIGRPNICYLPPIKGKCRIGEEQGAPGQRFGFNPYTNQCEPYEWSGCGGTRNRFIAKAKCEQHCTMDPPQSCSADSGIQIKHGQKIDEIQ